MLRPQWQLQQMYVFYNTSLFCMKQEIWHVMWAEDGIDEEQAGSFVQTNVWTRMLCHSVCNWDWLSVWAWRFEFLVTKIDCVQLCSWECWCMSSAPCLIKPASHRHSILEVSYSLTPLDAARVTNSILYLFCLPLSPVSLSHSAFV